MNEPIKIKVEFNENGWTPTPRHGKKYCASTPDKVFTRDLWMTGNTPQEAIGNLIAGYPLHFNIELSGLE